MNSWASAYGGWDDTHVHHGLLTSNQVALADGMVRHWDSFRQLGENAMQKRKGRSVLIDFGFEPEYYSEAPRPGSRDDFNGTLGAGLSAWCQYTHTGDRSYLERYYQLIAGIAQMLAGYALVPHGDRLWLRKARQIDDSFLDEGKENAFGPVVMAKALLSNAPLACEEMRDGEAALLYRQASERIELPVKDGVYVTFPGCPLEALSDESILNYFPAMIIPDREIAERTLDYYETTSLSTQGLQNNPAWRENRAVFPWVHFRAMIGELMLGRRQRFERLLEQVLANGCYASSFRLLPEYISRLGGWHNLPGFLTGAGALLQMVNMMLLQGDERSIRIFPAVPEAWLEERIAFRLRTAPGVLLDLVSVPDQAVSMQLESARPATVYLRKPAIVSGARMADVELAAQDGYVRFEVPAGPSRAVIAWRR